MSSLSQPSRGSDLCGLRFGKVTVLRRVPGTIGKWRIRCDCGKELERDGYPILIGKHKSCGQKRCRQRLTDEEAVSQLLLYRYKRNAKKRNLPFQLSLNDVREIITKDCYYCGSAPIIMSGLMTKENPKKAKVNGMDRINNNLGYFKSNVVSACPRCNQMKLAMTLNDFLEHVFTIYWRHKGAYGNANLGITKSKN